MDILSNRKLLLALAFPFIVLLIIVGYRQYEMRQYPTYIVPVAAYDPRAFLYGNYLVLQIADSEAGSVFKCSTAAKQTIEGLAYACLQSTADGWHVKLFTEKPSTNQCPVIWDGYCVRGVFHSSKVLHFYIPEASAQAIAEAMQKAKATMKVMVLPNGDVRPLALYLDGKPWEEYLK